MNLTLYYQESISSVTLCATMIAPTTYRNMQNRLLPGDPATGMRLASLRNACRFTWNEIKEAREQQVSHACGHKVEAPTFFAPGTVFKALRDAEPWLQDNSYAVLRDRLNTQAAAWKAFFEGRGGYPKCKSRYQTPSFTIPDNVRVRDCRLAVPRVGWLSLRRRGGNPVPEGKPVQAVVRREGKRRYATVCCAVAEHNCHAIGVEGKVGQVANNDGEIHRMPDVSRLEAKLRRHNRALSRKREGSRRCEAARRKATHSARRLANAPKAWHHRTSRNLAEKAGTVVIQKRNTQGMTRSAKGTRETPGKNVRAKGGLNRVILNTGWSAMQQMLAYRAVERIQVPAAYTSRTCSACGVVGCWRAARAGGASGAWPAAMRRTRT